MSKEVLVLLISYHAEKHTDLSCLSKNGNVKNSRLLLYFSEHIFAYPMPRRNPLYKTKTDFSDIEISIIRTVHTRTCPGFIY